MDNLAIDKSKKPSKECCICLDILILYTEQNRTEHRRLQKLSPDDEIFTYFSQHFVQTVSQTAVSGYTVQRQLHLYMFSLSLLWYKAITV